MTLKAEDILKILQEALKEGLLEYNIKEFKMGTKRQKPIKRFG